MPIQSKRTHGNKIPPPPKKNINTKFPLLLTAAHGDENLVDTLLLGVEEDGTAHAHQQVSILLEQGRLVSLQQG